MSPMLPGPATQGLPKAVEAAVLRYLFCLPSIHRLQTGGNLYNRCLIRLLRQRAEVRIWIEGSEFPEESQLSPREIPCPQTVVIDSLLLHHGQSVRSRLLCKTSVPLILMVHYLHLLDPRKASSPEAQEEREHLRWFDGFITTSEFSKKQLLSHGVSEDAVKAVPPGLATELHGGAERREPPDPPCILTVSSVLPQKGLLELLRLLEELHELSWRWELVGELTLDAEFARAFQKTLAHSLIADRVRVHGTLPEEQVAAMYDQAHMFVLPSAFESCSMVTMEAMGHGLPVVAYRTGGIPEQMARAEAGHLVPLGNAEAFALRLRDLLLHPQKRLMMRRKALQQSRGFLTWEQTALRVHEFLASLAHAPD